MRELRALGALMVAALLTALQLACGDQYRPVANPIVSPGGQPQTAHFAWVVNNNPSGAAGTTTEIDVSGDSNLSVQNMGVGSISEAFAPQSLALFVGNRDNDTVSEYLPTLNGAITTISLLSGSHPVQVGSSRQLFIYSLNSGANSACQTGGSISTIPTTSLSVSATTCVGPNPTVMAQAPRNFHIYVINGDGSVSDVDGVGMTLTGTITGQNGLGQKPVAVAASSDGNWIFLVTQGDGTGPGALDIVSTATACVPQVPPLNCVAASVPLGVRPTFALLDPVLNRLYVANTGDNTVSVFDASNVNPSGSTPIPLLATVPVGTGPIGITALASGATFYVVNAGSNDVTVVSANSFSPLTTVALPAGANPVFIASDPTSSKVYVADQGTSATTIIQTTNNTISGTIPAPPQVQGCVSNCALQQPVMIVTE